MTNNDVLRRLRYTFELKDQQVVKIFSLVNRSVSTDEVINWLKPDDDATMVPLSDIELASFLNGFIIEKRGRSDKALPQPEKILTKNLILKKLKIALNLTSEDIIALLAKSDIKVGNAELTALFRKPEHKNYRHCKSQFLRNFLMALQLTHRKAKKTQATSGKKAQGNKPMAKDKTQKAPSKKVRFDNPNASPYAAFEDKQPERKVLSIKPKKRP